MLVVVWRHGYIDKSYVFDIRSESGSNESLHQVSTLSSSQLSEINNVYSSNEEIYQIKTCGASTSGKGEWEDKHNKPGMHRGHAPATCGTLLAAAVKSHLRLTGLRIEMELLARANHIDLSHS